MFVRLLFPVLLRYSTVTVYLFSFLGPIRVKPRKPRLQSSRTATASYLSPPRVASQLAKKPSGDKVGKLRANFVLYSSESNGSQHRQRVEIESFPTIYFNFKNSQNRVGNPMLWLHKKFHIQPHTRAIWTVSQFDF